MLDKIFDHPYMYVFVRTDLSHAQQIVQAGHAIGEAFRNFVDKDDIHPSIIVLQVDNEEQLLDVADDIFYRKLLYKDQKLDHKIEFKIFREPDMDNQFTALATQPIYNEDRKFFSEFKLLR